MKNEMKERKEKNKTIERNMQEKWNEHLPPHLISFNLIIHKSIFQMKSVFLCNLMRAIDEN